MTDRELLEKAAQAAGMTIDRDCGNDGWTLSGDALTIGPDAAGEHGYWNPLADNGDALLLAVKLKIDIKQYDDHVVCWFDGGYIGTGKVMYNGDPYAATRQAIVRAAAEITVSIIQKQPTETGNPASPKAENSF